MMTSETASAPSVPVALVEPMVRAPIKRPRKVIVPEAPVPADAPVEQAPTPLEIQMAKQLKEQVRQTEVMKQMLASLQEAEAARKAEEARKVEAARKAEAVRKADASRKVEAACKAEEERKAARMRRTCAFLEQRGIKVVMPRAEMSEGLKLLVRQQLAAVEDYHKERVIAEDQAEWEIVNERPYYTSDSAHDAQTRRMGAKMSEIRRIAGEIHEKERELARPMEEERKRRELAVHLPLQEEARKRSAARIQAGEFSIWNRRETQMGPTTELITGRGNHVWSSDRTPITVDGNVCVGPRLGEYMGINFASIHFSMCGISRTCTSRDGATYDGTVEPKLY